MGHTPLTGMSHGASGFAYAFGLLFKVTADSRYLEATDRCLRFEEAVYDKAQGAWPDLREVANESDFTWPSQWCHGSTGIGLSRLALLTVCEMEESRIMKDLESSVLATLAAWPYSVDTVCCGSSGNMWFLYEAAQTLGRQSVLECRLKLRSLRALL